MLLDTTTSGSDAQISESPMHLADTELTGDANRMVIEHPTGKTKKTERTATDPQTVRLSKSIRLALRKLKSTEKAFEKLRKVFKSTRKAPQSTNKHPTARETRKRHESDTKR